MARGKDISVEALRHKDKRRNIPTAELEPVMDEKDKTPIRLAYERRNRDLDPQLVWRGKDEQDWSDLIVQAPPLYIQEKVHPKVLIDDLLHSITIGSRGGADQGWTGSQGLIGFYCWEIHFGTSAIGTISESVTWRIYGSIPAEAGSQIRKNTSSRPLH